MNKQDELEQTLRILKDCRVRLLHRTISETPDLFRGLFDFEDNMDALDLLFQKELSIFLNSHFESAGNIICDDNFSPTFNSTLIKLIQKFMPFTNNQIDVKLIEVILKEKIKSIESISSVEKNSNNNLSKLKYQVSKDTRLFQREIDNHLNVKENS
jgi:hypothetical protein